MTAGVSFLISLCIGYACWQACNIENNMPKTIESKRPKTGGEKQEKEMLFYPLSLTPKKAERLARVLLYGGLLLALLIYAVTLDYLVPMVIFVTCFLGSFFSVKAVEWTIRNRKRQMVAELHVYLDTFLSLTKAGLNTEDALRDALVVTRYLPALMNPVLDKWHDHGGAEKAVKLLEKSELTEIKTLATMLMQVIRGSEKAFEFIEQWKDQLLMMEYLNREAKANTKPVFYTILLGLPFFASVITWFYPYFVQARDMFSGFLGM
ncbi:hypothetical protein GCM10010965_27630 [Caldalkalibacillus thermarum]|uniref:hypothetical protein n=1 Tax=Caldalkalibacillus thermarum TaxID=296745 RepID=UPI0016650425|nr:hypothetical protein [Caldalkalibacillus thermarum]GGK33251.1 hypothetical protein GCM10010965_27630 [Caldalkalibacillus thermarum]